MRRQIVVQLCFRFVVLSLLRSCGETLVVSDFFGYPFGEDEDNTFPNADDISLFINTSIQFPYFQSFYTGISVDINGHCTFSDQLVGSDFSPRPLQSIELPRVAPFWVDLNVVAGGNVYYRVLVNGSTDEAQAILASISRQSSAVLLPDIKFNVKWALLVTWNRVPFYRDSERNATFQLVVATDGIYSVMMFLYDREIEIRSETTIGFAAGTMSTFYQMPMNQTQNVHTRSNAGQAGLWLFRIDGGDSLSGVKGKVLFDCFWHLEVASSIIQWYKDDVMLNDTTNIAGTSTNYLSVSDIAGSDFGLYQCYVEDFLSKAVVLTVSPRGSVRTLPNSLLTTAGDSVSFKCSADGGPDNTFYWRHNGEVLANETMSFLNVSAVTTDDLGLYTCVVTNNAGSGSSTSVIHGSAAQRPGGGLCTNYTKRVMSREVEVCLPTFFTTFSSTYLRHTVIVYSPSDQPVNLEPSDQEDLLQYLYPRAQMDENANPRTFAVYENTSNVPVSLTVDGLQPSTTYLIFVHVQMLYQGAVVTSYFSDVITVMTAAETPTATASQTMYTVTVSAMGSVIAFLVVCGVLLTTFLLCRIHFIQKQHLNHSSSTENALGSKCIYQTNTETCTIEQNPAYSSVSRANCSTVTATEHLDCSLKDRSDEESGKIYEDVDVL